MQGSVDAGRRRMEVRAEGTEGKGVGGALEGAAMAVEECKEEEEEGDDEGEEGAAMGDWQEMVGALDALLPASWNLETEQAAGNDGEEGGHREVGEGSKESGAGAGRAAEGCSDEASGQSGVEVAEQQGRGESAGEEDVQKEEVIENLAPEVCDPHVAAAVCAAAPLAVLLSGSPLPTLAPQPPLLGLQHLAADAAAAAASMAMGDASGERTGPMQVAGERAARGTGDSALMLVRGREATFGSWQQVDVVQR
ncbi:hypothetical protein CLOM_g6496 [Closterium sp. NIES-68]|nr:hypothetical protein CLOM_g6496 [Closterium sp. NIES-68]